MQIDRDEYYSGYAFMLLGETKAWWAKKQMWICVGKKGKNGRCILCLSSRVLYAEVEWGLSSWQICRWWVVVCACSVWRK